MLFSQPEIAAFLNQNFECAWESLRPVPRVDIDFGNGHRLRRTLNGNIATWFCTPDGKAFDLLPGLVGPEEFLARAQLAASVHGALPPRNAERLVAQYHARARELAGKSAAEVREAGEREAMYADLAKRQVEFNVKRSLGGLLVNLAEAKSATEGKLDAELAADTRFNAEHRYPLAHKLLAQRPLAKPAELAKEVFRTILHTDLDDPYLGLAPYVLGGKGGRSSG